MRKKPMKEWSLDVPWGNLAMVSWGESCKPPVLLVHGYVDTAATFIPLVQLLPDTHYYVAFDLPGHGLSDVSPGPPVTYLHFADVIRHVADRLGWDTFACIAHSMGYLISSFFNAAFPGRMVKLVNLDGAVGFGLHAMADQYTVWFEHCYARYYESYFPGPKQVLYTYDDAIALLTKARGVTAAQAAVLASRCLAAVGDGVYRFTWDPKVKKIGTMIFSLESLFAIFATHPPTLNIVASERNTMSVNKEFSNTMVDKLHRETPNYLIVNVEGGHDVHFTNPESFVGSLIEFLNRDFSVKSKL